MFSCKEIRNVNEETSFIIQRPQLECRPLDSLICVDAKTLCSLDECIVQFSCYIPSGRKKQFFLFDPVKKVDHLIRGGEKGLIYENAHIRLDYNFAHGKRWKGDVELSSCSIDGENFEEENNHRDDVKHSTFYDWTEVLPVKLPSYCYASGNLASIICVDSNYFEEDGGLLTIDACVSWIEPEILVQSSGNLAEYLYPYECELKSLNLGGFDIDSIQRTFDREASSD